MKFATALLLAFSLPAIAQAPAQPQPQPQEQKRERGDTSLNLKLDEGGTRGAIRFEPRERVDEKKAESGLPGLGESARSLESAPATTRSSPYPQDTERVYR